MLDLPWWGELISGVAGHLSLEEASLQVLREGHPRGGLEKIIRDISAAKA